ncbi:putative LRR receptor-like serine/threonine-protein kinase [Hordeum vulgare]|nr:putative LRR receptor-like serine/threonine-protein kinase [Hordeum vulgare]
MASFRLEEAVQPLCDVIDSMQCWMLRMKNFIERAEDAPGGLYQALLLLHTLVVPEGNFEVERRARLHGRLSPRARTSSLLSASKGLNKYVVVTRVLQMMRELQDLCGDPVQPLSVEQLRVVPDRSRLKSSQTLDAEECGGLDVAISRSPKSIGCQASALDVAALCSFVPIEQVMPVSGMNTEPSVLAPSPNPNALFAKELCDLLTSVEVARHGLGRSIACLLTGMPIRGK